MGQVSHVAAHAAIVATVLAAVERLIGRMGADMFEDAAQDVVGKADKLVGPVVVVDGGGVEVVARTRFGLLGGLVAAEALEEAHDATRGAKKESEGVWRACRQTAAEGIFQEGLGCRRGCFFVRCFKKWVG